MKEEALGLPMPTPVAGGTKGKIRIGAIYSQNFLMFGALRLNS
jgi:hypothetical protein